MRSISDLKDEKVRQLAQTLKSSGLAASETEAIRMATEMSNTASKINQTFNDRKEESTMGLAYLKKDYAKKGNEEVEFSKEVSVHKSPESNNIGVEETEEFVYQNVIGSADTNARKEDLIEEVIEEVSVEEANNTVQPRISMGLDFSTIKVNEAAGAVTHSKDADLDETEDDFEDDFFVEEMEKYSDETPAEESTEPAKEEKSAEKQKAPQKRDLSEFEESRVSLADVFKSK